MSPIPLLAGVLALVLTWASPVLPILLKSWAALRAALAGALP